MLYYPDLIPAARTATADSQAPASKLSGVSDATNPMTQSPKITPRAESFSVEKHVHLDAEANIQVTKSYKKITISFRCESSSSA